MSTTSPKFWLNLEDFVKGLAVSALSQPVLVILTSFAAGHFDVDWTKQWQLAVASGAGYLIKNFLSGPTPPMAGAINGAAVKTMFVVVLCLTGMAGFGQSIVKPLPLTPKQVPHIDHLNRAIILPTDTFPNITNGHFNGFRFSGPDLAFAVPDFSIYTGLGIDWVSATADPATGKWTYDFTIGPRVYGGANLGEPTVRAIGAVGLRATFFKGWLALGAIYNLTTKKPQATIGNPAALIPGLN